MCHPERLAWPNKAKAKYPDHFRRVRALDAGGACRNELNRSLFEDSTYLCCDLKEHPSVDVICRVHELPFVDGWFDTILCCEMLEHDWSWPASLGKMARLLRPGGLLVMTWGAQGRKEHGTPRRLPQVSLTSALDYPFYYRNLTADEVLKELHDASPRWEYELGENEKFCDIYFMGVKRA